MALAAATKFSVDATDIDILRTLAQAGSGRLRAQRLTMEEVASALGLHTNTVFTRVKRMQEGGLFSRFIALPDPNVLGYSLGHYHVTLPMRARTPELLDDVFRLGCVFLVIETVEGWDITPVAPDEAALDALALAIRQRVGAPKGEWSMRSKADWPALAPIELDEIDLRILEALLVDANAPMEEVAAEHDLNPRTVQRHHERLREAEAYRTYARFEAIFTGLAFRHVQFSVAPGPARAATIESLGRLMPNTMIRQELTRGIQFILYGDEPGELQSQIEEGAAIKGVHVEYNLTLRRGIYSPYFPEQMLAILRAQRNGGFT